MIVCSRVPMSRAPSASLRERFAPLHMGRVRSIRRLPGTRHTPGQRASPSAWREPSPGSRHPPYSATRHDRRPEKIMKIFDGTYRHHRCHRGGARCLRSTAVESPGKSALFLADRWPSRAIRSAQYAVPYRRTVMDCGIHQALRPVRRASAATTARSLYDIVRFMAVTYPTMNHLTAFGTAPPLSNTEVG